MRKKILFIITKAEWGGAQRFLFELITHLDRNSYECVIAAGEPGELLEKLNHRDFKTSILKHLNNSFSFRNVAVIWEIYRLIRKIRPDILYLNSSMAGFWGSPAGWLGRCPKIIYRIGGWAFKEPRHKLIKLAYLWAEKISSPFKDIIIVNSEFDRRLAIKNKIARPQKIITIYNGLDFKELKFLPKESAFDHLSKISGLTFPPSHPLIGTIANLYKNKGLEYLVKAIAILKKSTQFNAARLIVIGEGEERKKLEHLIQTQGLENSIFLVGQFPDAYKYLKAFDLFVLPSIKEGQPWVILEAMAVGVPIIATNIAGISEMIENEISGLLVEPGEAASFVGAMEKILTHPSLAQDCVKNAENKVRSDFDVNIMVRKNEALF